MKNIVFCFTLVCCVLCELCESVLALEAIEERPYLIARLQHDLPTYITAANGVSIDHGNKGDFTKGILSWWKSPASEVEAWSEAARIALAMAPNSAGAERVFSLLKILFGSNQDTAFSDYICGSNMLRYNNTRRANHARKYSSAWPEML